MRVEFNDTQLMQYSKVLDKDCFAPTTIFKEHFGLPQDTPIPVDDVEDFMIAFFTTYNMTFGTKY